MITASFTGFLKTIAILILIYYTIRILFRLFAPVLINQMARKMEQSFYEQHNRHQQQQPDKVVRERPKETKKVGEYIDYEEIE